MKKNMLIIGITILLGIFFLLGYKSYKYYQMKTEKKIVKLK